MELHKLHVLEHRAGPVSHGHAVAGRVGRIGRARVELPRAARRKNHRPRRYDKPRAGRLVQHERAAAPAAGHHQVHREMMAEPLDALLPAGLDGQRPHHLVAGGVAARTEDAAAAVRGFVGEGELAADLVEAGAPGDQLANAARPLLHEHAHRIAPAEAVARFQRVVQMEGDVVFFAEGDRHAALRMDRAAFQRIALGQHQHPAVPAQFDRRAKARDAAADHQELRLGRMRNGRNAAASGH